MCFLCFLGFLQEFLMFFGDSLMILVGGFHFESMAVIGVR